MQIKKYIKNILKFFRHIVHKTERKIIKPSYHKLKVMSDEETINKILDGYSLARYGDGEFQWMFGSNKHSFQKDSKELAKKLKETFNTKDKKFLLCICNFADIDKYCYNDQLYWEVFLKRNWKNYEQIFDFNKVYGNAMISRPYMMYNNKYRKLARGKFENLKKVWDNKKILIIEGEKTRMGVGNDLLDNVKQIKRLLCPARDAFDCYNEIIETVKNIEYKPDLVLIALGPTATILALDLHRLGFQTLDIGHIDVEYEWYKKGAKNRTPIDGKYVNECLDNNSINTSLDDKKYENSIIGIIK